MLTDVVRGGVLVEPPLIEKGGVAKNDSIVFTFRSFYVLYDLDFVVYVLDISLPQ